MKLDIIIAAFIGIVLPALIYIIRHEKEHTRLWLIVKQLCSKAHIDDGD